MKILWLNIVQDPFHVVQVIYVDTGDSLDGTTTEVDNAELVVSVLLVRGSFNWHLQFLHHSAASVGFARSLFSVTAGTELYYNRHVIYS